MDTGILINVITITARFFCRCLEKTMGFFLMCSLRLNMDNTLEICKSVGINSLQLDLKYLCSLVRVEYS